MVEHPWYFENQAQRSDCQKGRGQGIAVKDGARRSDGAQEDTA
jgi:hypothetical protein